MDNEYVIGSGNAPAWVENRVTAYKKLNGDIGYEFCGKMRDYILRAGDKLIKDGRKIRIKRGARKCEQ